MSDPNPNPPAGGVPPKPADAAKVQPKKETVRITLPPKAGGRPTSSAQIEAAGRSAASAVPETKLAGSTSSLNLVVPQIKETEANVKIPGAVEAQAGAAAPMQTGPKFTPPSAPITHFEPPKSGVAGISLASKSSAPAPAAAPAAPAPAKSKAGGSSGKTNVVDATLAFLAAAACIAFAVRLYLLLQSYSS
ncbi:MAG: hypothetical protein HZA89_14125 [Verrucomicrobia bacterium]|nr:hypothetical protein [Verrucomicrobiota bacterium]